MQEYGNQSHLVLIMLDRSARRHELLQQLLPGESLDLAFTLIGRFEGASSHNVLLH